MHGAKWKSPKAFPYGNNVFCGIQGGATETRIVIVDPHSDEINRKLQDRRFFSIIGGEKNGTNFLRHKENKMVKVKKSTRYENEWTHKNSDERYKVVREIIYKAVKKLLGEVNEVRKRTATDDAILKSICMVLPGVTDASLGDEFTRQFTRAYCSGGENHLADSFHFISEVDAVANAHFSPVHMAKKRNLHVPFTGVVLQAGLDSHCKVVSSDGECVSASEGLNNQIYPGGGALWVARTALSMCQEKRENNFAWWFDALRGRKYDKDDFDEATIKRAEEKADFILMFKSHLKDAYTDHYALMRTIFSRAQTYKLSKFSLEIAELKDKTAVNRLFERAGKALGQLVINVLKEVEKGERKKVSLLIFGRVFRHIEHVYLGLIERLGDREAGSEVEELQLLQMCEEMTVNAATHCALRYQKALDISAPIVLAQNAYPRNPN